MDNDIPIDPIEDTASVPPAPQPPQPDTVSYIKRLEVYYAQNNPQITTKSIDYSFYYDDNHRLKSVGMKSHNYFFFDTATAILKYIDDERKPYLIITPNHWMSSSERGIFYDTTYFEYNASNQIVKDSSFQLANHYTDASPKRRLLVRNYYHSDSNSCVIDWHVFWPEIGHEIVRRDTLYHSSDTLISNLKTHFNPAHTPPGNYATASWFTYTGFINPLAQLNISGTVFALIYTPVDLEVLGNQFHKAVLQSNILPFYLDFYSAKIPSGFFLGGYHASGWLISASSDQFDIQIEPWASRNNYPSSISVGARSALDDRVVYKYFY